MRQCTAVSVRTLAAPAIWSGSWVGANRPHAAGGGDAPWGNSSNSVFALLNSADAMPPPPPRPTAAVAVNGGGGPKKEKRYKKEKKVRIQNPARYRAAVLG